MIIRIVAEALLMGLIILFSFSFVIKLTQYVTLKKTTLFPETIIISILVATLYFLRNF